jgi:hypothetical protein
MTQDLSSRQKYYQTIARTFLKHQASLFFLPPRDLELISEWEKMEIPLEVILEGIEKTFARQLTRKRQRRIFSLSQCEREILKTYAQHQERLVGQKAGPVDRQSKTARARAEIENFLKNFPPDLEALKKIMSQAAEELKKETPDEPVLEALDEEVDRIIWEMSPVEEKIRALEESRQDYPGQSDKDLIEIQRTRLIKSQRQLHRIPYAALFYY